MAQKAQIRIRRLSAVMIGWIAIALVVPTGAWAGSDSYRHSWNRSWDQDDHRGHDRYRHHDDRRGSSKHHYDRHTDRHHYNRHDSSRHHRDYYSGYGHHALRYFCHPCNHYFSSQTALYHHVGGHHHVPFWRLAHAIAVTTIGLIFYG